MSTDDPTTLVADIGGTNARFAMMDSEGRVMRADTLKVADYSSFEAALDAFLAAGAERPTCAGFAVAGPVTGGKARFTNSPWRIDEAHIAATHEFAACVMNDFAALAHYAIDPQKDDVAELKAGTPLVGAPVLVLGPGTGLGQSLAIPHAWGAEAVATEGGHGVLPVVSEEERALLPLLTEDLDRVPTAEDALSGDGLERLHRVRGKLLGEAVPSDIAAAAITEGALSNDLFCQQTVRQFLLFLATVASNAALGTGARGGVMFGGGILPRIQPLFEGSGFPERFVGTSPMADYLEKIPVRLIVKGDAAQRGAFRAASCRTQG